MLISFIMIAALALNATAGELTIAPKDLPVTLKAAIDMAINNRPEVKIGKEQIRLEESRYREREGLFLPTADLSAFTQYLRNYDDYTGLDIISQLDGHEVAATIERTVPTFQIGAGVEVGYNIYSGGRDSAAINEAKGRVASSEAGKKVAERKVTLMVSKAFWELRKAQINSGIAAIELEYSRSALLVSDSQLKSSRIPSIERDTQALEVREKETALADCRSVLASCFSTYLNALGISGKVEISAGQIPALKVDSDQLPVKDEGERPEISRLKADMVAANARKAIAAADNFPKLDFFAKYQLTGRDDSYFHSGQDIKSDNLVVGVKLTSNIFDGFRTTERQRAAKAEANISKLKLELKEKEIAEICQNHSENLERAKNGLSLSMQRLELKKAQEKLSVAKLKAGHCSDLEYRKTRLEMDKASENVNIDKINVAVARINLVLDSSDL